MRRASCARHVDSTSPGTRDASGPRLHRTKLWCFCFAGVDSLRNRFTTILQPCWLYSFDEAVLPFIRATTLPMGPQSAVYDRSAGFAQWKTQNRARLDQLDI